MSVCNGNGPAKGIPMVMGGKDKIPPPTIPLWKGSRCVPTMGLDRAVHKVGLDR